MTKEERKEQIRMRILAAVVYSAEVIGAIFFIAGCERVLATEQTNPPVAGFTAAMNDIDLAKEIVEEQVEVIECEQELNYQLVDSTAYYDAYGYGYGSGGRPLIEGLTIAGPIKWLDKKVDVYAVNSDGSVGDLIGHYQFLDTGYGQPTGYGSSKIIEGRTIGTIESGECIDFYFDTIEKCTTWARRKVYIVVEE